MVANFHAYQGKTKTVVMIFFQYCLTLMIIGRIFLLSVCVCFQGRFCIAFCSSDAGFVISLLLRVIYNEGTCSFVFGFTLEEFAVVYDRSGKAYWVHFLIVGRL